MATDDTSKSGPGAIEGSGGMLNLLALPDEERCLGQWVLRQGSVTFEEVVEYAGGEENARSLVAALTEKGFVVPTSENEERLRIQLPPRRPRRLPDSLWEALDRKPPPKEPGPGGEFSP